MMMMLVVMMLVTMSMSITTMMIERIKIEGRKMGLELVVLVSNLLGGKSLSSGQDRDKEFLPRVGKRRSFLHEGRQTSPGATQVSLSPYSPPPPPSPPPTSLLHHHNHPSSMPS